MTAVTAAWPNSLPAPLSAACCRRTRKASNRSSIPNSAATARWGLANGGLDQLPSGLAVPFCGTQQAADLAALLVDQQGGGKAGGPERGGKARGRIGIDGKIWRFGFLQELFGARNPGAIDADCHHLELVGAQARLQPVERRHSLAPRQTPGRPKIEKHHLAPPVGEGTLATVRVLEFDLGQNLWFPAENEGGKLAAAGAAPTFPGGGWWRGGLRLHHGRCRRPRGVVRMAQRHVYGCEADARGQRRRQRGGAG